MKLFKTSIYLLFLTNTIVVFSQTKNDSKVDMINNFIKSSSRTLSLNSNEKIIALPLATDHSTAMISLKAAYNDEVKRVRIIKMEYDKKHPTESDIQNYLYSKKITYFEFFEGKLAKVSNSYHYLSPLLYFSGNDFVKTGFPIENSVSVSLKSDKELLKDAKKYYALFEEQKNEDNENKAPVYSNDLTRSFQSNEDKLYIKDIDDLFRKENIIMAGSERDHYTFEQDGESYRLSAKYYSSTENFQIRVFRRDYNRDYAFFYKKGQLSKGWQSHRFNLNDRYFWKGKSIHHASQKDTILDVAIHFDKLAMYYDLYKKHEKQLFKNMKFEEISEELWFTDKDKAIKKAKKENKLILIDFTGSDWCGYCIKQRKEIFNTPEFQKYAKNNLVLLELDYPKRKEQEPKLKAQNETLKTAFEIRAYPTVLLVDHHLSKSEIYKKYEGYPGLTVKQYIDQIDEQINSFRSRN